MKFRETFSSTSRTLVNFDIYLPNVMIRYKAIIQIHHAMGEHLGRYQKFAEYLAHDGFVVVVSDFPGHGMSLHNFEQGYFGAGDATVNLIEDMQRLRNIIASRFPDLPYYIMGNELGSVVLRKYAAIYGDYIQGCIFMATCGKLKGAYLSNLFLKGDALLRGNMHRSRTVKKNLSKTRPYVIEDLEELEKYQEDPFTGFVYTNQAYCDILKLVKEVTSSDMIAQIPNHLSVLIISGVHDVFGKLGKGPKWLYERLKNNGLSDISFKLYEDSHHDILHDKERKLVYNDILKWLNERTFI